MAAVQPLAPGVARLATFTQRLQRCCDRVEVAFSEGRLRVSDVELVYTSGFLSIVTRWEAFLEECLFETVCGAAPARLVDRRHVQVKSRSRLQKVLLHPEKEYISLTTVKQAEGLYKLFLQEGAPFSAISEPNRTFIQQAIWIRNAIAHSSSAASSAFRDKVPGVTSLPQNRRYPGAFLRHEFRVSPNQRRLNLYCSALVSAAREMASSWTART